MNPLAAGDPQRIGDFWLAGRLGAGGQGVVYDAYDGEGRRVALKVLHEGDRDQLTREATAAQRVASFCTARILGVDLDGSRPYIVSEYVPGPSLRTARRIFTGDDLYRLGTAIATALSAIHEAGVVHRDLKPDNVLLSPDGPRVIDFGIARTDDMSLSATGAVSGTPTYMAPEVFTGQRAGAKADVFAWGAIMVFAATGEDPFRADNLGSVMHRVLSEQPDLSAVPQNLRPLVAAALAKDPARRPSSRDLLLALVSGNSADLRVLLTEGSRTASGVRGEAGDPELGALAEQAFAALPQAEQELVPEIFLRLVTVGEDGWEAARPAHRDELMAGRPADEVEHILRVFSYVLTEEDGLVALSRPGLLRAWRRLRQWVDAERDGLAVLGQISNAARHWADHGRRDGDVLQGSRLESALSWAVAGRRHITLTPQERDFLNAATQATRRRARRRRLAIGALAALLVVAVAAGAFAVRQGQVAAAGRDVASGRQAAAEADRLRTTDPVLAMLLSTAAWRLAPGADTRASLMASLVQPESAVFRQPPAKGPSVRAVSQDGRLLASAATEGVRLYDVASGRQTGSWSWSGVTPLSAALDAGGKALAVVTQGAVTVWDTATGKKLGSHPIPLGSGLAIPSFGLSPTTLAVARLGDVEFLWDYRTGHVVPTPLTGTESIAIAPDGRTYAGVGSAALPKGCGPMMTYSHDGRHFLCAGELIRRFEVATGREVKPKDAEYWPWGQRDGEAANATHRGIRLNASDTELLGFADETIRVWDVETGDERFSHTADGPIEDAWFDPSDQAVRYLQDDAVVTLDLRPRVTSTRMPKGETALGLSQDGRWAVSAPEGDKPMRLWDVRARRFTGELPGGVEVGKGVVFDRAATTMVTTLGTSTLAAWDTGGRRQLWKHELAEGIQVNDFTFSPDGKMLVVALQEPYPDGHPARDHLLELDARTGREIRKLATSAPPGLAFGADGRSLILADGRIVDVTTGKPVGSGFNTAGGLVAASPVGPMMAVTGTEGTVAIWDVSRQAPVPPVLHGAPRMSPDQLAFSGDGTLVATYSSESESGQTVVQVWDVATKRRLVAVPLHGDFPEGGLAFTADGSSLVAQDQQGTLTTIPVGGDRAAAAVCARAGRTLTDAEWAAHLPDVPKRKVC
ncbi:protein kinase [Nonomuraea sp. NPDC050556]|uniref:WD40 repeat domain-containing serine/threonine protein kinase n=1 Tax=Nonomuraea sp. NPDC050556 TaxID=3364369 RepID=UPI00379EB3DD